MSAISLNHTKDLYDKYDKEDNKEEDKYNDEKFNRTNSIRSVANIITNENSTDTQPVKPRRRSSIHGPPPVRSYNKEEDELCICSCNCVTQKLSLTREESRHLNILLLESRTHLVEECLQQLHIDLIRYLSHIEMYDKDSQHDLKRILEKLVNKQKKFETDREMREKFRRDSEMKKRYQASRNRLNSKRVYTV
jgi:hypothetical protein